MSTAARQLRHPGAGAAAARPALVHRQRRRDLAVANLIYDEQARLHRRLRRRPRVPDGPAADGRRSTSSPAPASTVAGIRVPRHEATAFGVIDADADGKVRRLPGEAGRPAGPAGRPRRDASPRWATTSSPPRRCSRRCATDAEDEDSVHDMGGKHHADDGRRRARPTSTTSPTTTCPAPTERDRGYWRDVGTHRRLLRRAHGPGLGAPDLQPLQPAVADLHPPRRSCRRRSSSRAAWRRSRWSAPARSSPARTVRHSVVSPDVRVAAGAVRRGLGADGRRPDRPGRGRAPGDPGQERRRARRARTSASTRSSTGTRYHVSRRRRRRARQKPTRAAVAGAGTRRRAGTTHAEVAELGRPARRWTATSGPMPAWSGSAPPGWPPSSDLVDRGLSRRRSRRRAGRRRRGRAQRRIPARRPGRVPALGDRQLWGVEAAVGLYRADAGRARPRWPTRSAPTWCAGSARSGWPGCPASPSRRSEAADRARELADCAAHAGALRRARHRGRGLRRPARAGAVPARRRRHEPGRAGDRAGHRLRAAGRAARAHGGSRRRRRPGRHRARQRLGAAS